MRQMIFYAMTEAELFDPAITLRSVADIHSKGFDSIYLEFRNTRTPRHAPRFREAVERLCREASRLGLAVVLDASLNGQQAAMVEEHPELFTDSVSARRVPVSNGRFILDISHSDPSVALLENVWRIAPEGTAWRVEEAGARCRLLGQVCEGGGCAMTRQRGGVVARQTWAVDGVADGELLVALRMRYSYTNRDLGHPAQAVYVERACDAAAVHPVCGVVWDEPHFGFDFLNDAYPISDRLHGVFRERFGYGLRSRWVDLWLDVADRDSGQVRLDFAELLESQLAVLEQDFKRRALAHPGLGAGRPSFFVGIHRTMHEELSDDFRIGSVDYFRHNRGLTAGCTDSVFEREDSMVTMNLLARTLGSLSGSGEAWNNSWGFRPTQRHLDYYLRLMGCLGVRWLGHTYHGSMLFGPGYPHHPTWDGMGDLLATHRGILDQLEGATPVCDTAVVYHWRGLADFPGNYLHQHRRSLLMACLELCVGQAAVTLVDPSQLPGSHFRRILVLWPSRLDAVAWDALDAAAAGGSEILLAGPPAWRDATGGDASQRWAKLAGCAIPERTREMRIPYGAELEASGRTFVLDPARAVPNWQSNPENTYSDHLKAWALDGGEPILAWNGRVIGTRCGRVTTVTTELPQIPGALAALWPETPVAPQGLLAFAYQRDDAQLLALCARNAEPVTATFAWHGRRVTLRGARHAVLRGTPGGQVTAWGEGVDLL